ncbi:MAG TPA: hypothetical protein VIT41_18785 [Microlunatus sp.]
MTGIPGQLVWRLLVLTIWLVCTLLNVHDPFATGSGTADVGRRPPTFDQSYPYADGLAVSTDIWTGRRLGVPVVELTVEVRNDSHHTFEAWLSGDLRYGASRRPAVRYLIPPGPDDLGSVQLIAIGASSDPYLLRYVLSPDHCEDVVFEVRIDGGVHEPAVFAGPLT